MMTHCSEIVEKYRDYSIERDSRGIFVRDADDGMKRRRCMTVAYARQLVDYFANREQGLPYEWPEPEAAQLLREALTHRGHCMTYVPGTKGSYGHWVAEGTGLAAGSPAELRVLIDNRYSCVA